MGSRYSLYTDSLVGHLFSLFRQLCIRFTETTSALAPQSRNADTSVPILGPSAAKAARRTCSVPILQGKLLARYWIVGNLSIRRSGGATPRR